MRLVTILIWMSLKTICWRLGFLLSQRSILFHYWGCISWHPTTVTCLSGIRCLPWGESVACIPEWVKVGHSRLKVKLPLHTEVLASCRVTQGSKHFRVPCTVAQPANNIWWYTEDGLVIGLSLVASDHVTHYTGDEHVWRHTYAWKNAIARCVPGWVT